jgi:hypothetical protein
LQNKNSFLHILSVAARTHALDALRGWCAVPKIFYERERSAVFVPGDDMDQNICRLPLILAESRWIKFSFRNQKHNQRSTVK